MVEIWPEKYENKDHILKEEKELLKSANKIMFDGNLIVNIDPLGIENENTKYGILLDPESGLVTFSLITKKFDIDEIDNYMFLRDYIENEIYKILLDAKVLISTDGVRKKLCFPYKHVLLFQNSKPTNIAPLVIGEEKAEYARKYFYAKNFKCIDENDFEYPFDSFNDNYESTFKMISDDQRIATIGRLAPEYVIFMNEKENIKVVKTKDKLSNDDFKITGLEREYKTFLLDPDQVNLINDMGTGHRVILANPGAGKSVILLSKAFKYASLYPDDTILVTCYNNNLADSYRFRIAQTRFANKKNIEAKTLHSLVGDIYSSLHKPMVNAYASEEEIDNCLKWIRNGLYTKKYKAIFVDEVQIFEPKYLDLCYELIDEDDDMFTFTLAGDLNQNVRIKSRRGDAPWKKMLQKLDFTGRVKYIEKNYRNTKQIGEYIKNMIDNINIKLDQYGILKDKEFVYEFDKGEKEGPDVIIKAGLSRVNIVKQVVDEMERIVKKYKLSYSDVAILFPYASHRSVSYYIQLWLENELNERNIDHSYIFPSKTGKTTFSKTTGVVLSTIDSSLGLDFSCTIVCGLFPYNYIFENKKKLVKQWKDIKDMEEEEKADYTSHIRKVYTACSRARNILCIMSDLYENTPIDELIRGGK